MSTKNLARTVIEGGRSGSSKYLRRASSQWLRVDHRRFCKMMVADQENWDNTPFPLRHREWDDISHADKTNPCERWLIAQTGRPWDDVRSDIFKRFGRKTLAGRHIIFDHLIDQVEEKRLWPWPTTWGFRIDDTGLLQHTPRVRWQTLQRREFFRKLTQDEG